MALAFCAATGAAEPVAHELSVQLEPDTGVVRAVDRLGLPPDAGDSIEFELNAAFEVHAKGGTLELLGESSRAGGVPVKRYRLSSGGDSTVELRYQGRPPQDDPRAVDATFVLGSGEAYFDPQAAWYPQPLGRAATFVLEADLPAGWRLVSEGRRYELSSGRAVQWVARQPVRGIHFVAGPLVEYRRLSPWGEALVYLREADPPLAERYLDATVEYLQLYSRLLGPYPYSKFALVENSRQTGYGMPSFTLIGSRVLRLPFILQTSYPHEIVHSWWGNAVWVDYERGNWAEGLTTYLADHLMAVGQGRGMAYRRAVLQKYADFVAGERDFSLRAFTARHDEASQAVGYGKTMMLFHMLRRQVGDARFVQGLRRFYDQYRFRTASFDDLAAVFGTLADEDLAWFFEQWLERVGAPKLHLGSVEVEQAADGYRLRGTLMQSQAGAPYRLTVPVAVQLRDRELALETGVDLTDKRKRFELLLPAEPQRVAIDPRYDLFRRLDEKEVPISVGRLFGAARRLFIVPEEGDLAGAYRAFAEALAEPGDRIVSDREVRALPWEGAVWVLGWNNRFRIRVAGALRTEARLTSGAVQVAGEEFSSDSQSVVLTATDDQRALAWVGAPSAGALERLARKLPHYSRYGYLVFSGDRAENVVKGEWSLQDSPLNRPLVNRAPPLRLAPRPALTAVIRTP